MDTHFINALAEMSRAFLHVHDENVHLKRELLDKEIECQKQIEVRDAEISHLISENLQYLTQSKAMATDDSNHQAPGKPCEMCGNPVSKPTLRFCSTSCQVKFSHKQRGHNTSGNPTSKRRYTHRKHKIVVAEPEANQHQTVEPGEGKSTALGK